MGLQPDDGRKAARLGFVEIEEGCHAIHGRHPVKINQEVARFLDLPQPNRRTWRSAWSRDERRALFISSPIGLGHVHRDLAIARELRQLVPDLQIEWLAQLYWRL